MTNFMAWPLYAWSFLLVLNFFKLQNRSIQFIFIIFSSKFSFITFQKSDY